jgi:hypothetical protein
MSMVAGMNHKTSRPHSSNSDPTSTPGGIGKHWATFEECYLIGRREPRRAVRRAVEPDETIADPVETVRRALEWLRQ